MDESEFWGHLEYRICREFASFQENHLRFIWCDGFIPVNYMLDSSDPYIDGIVWMPGNGPAEWEFRLLLGEGIHSIDEIPWPVLLPGDDATDWLTFDLARRTMTINPLHRPIAGFD